MQTAEEIFNAIQADEQNADYTAAGVKPLYKAPTTAELLIISQAPSRKAQETESFWNDPSGDRLRAWMGVTPEEFYQSGKIGILPLDFYYPGKAKSGDLPPRKGFAEKWHEPILALMPHVQLTLLIGMYAQRYYLGKRRQQTLTATVKHYQDYLPQYLPLVHPSPLNYGWFRRNPWFDDQVVPDLQKRVRALL